MAHSFVYTTGLNNQSGNPISWNVTPGTAASVCILSIVCPAARAGGAPTIDGTTATQINSTRVSAEQQTEMWYVAKAYSGAQITIGIPNTSAYFCQIEVVFAYAGSGYSSELTSSNGGIVNPGNSLTRTVTASAAGDFCYARQGNGEASVSSVTYSGTSATATFANDHGAYTSWGHYLVTSGSGTITFTYNFSNDDATLVACCFKTGVKSIVAGSGSYSSSGTAASTIKASRVDAAASSYSSTGTSATLGIGKRVDAATSSYTSTGTAATFTKISTFPADTSSYTLTGTPATLTKTGLTYSLSCNKGTYLHQGGDYLYDESGNILTADDGITPLTNDIPLVVLRKGGLSISADSTSYTITGQAANLIPSHNALSANSGTYSSTGTSAGLVPAYRISANTSAYLSTGTSVTLTHIGSIGADTTSYLVTGTSATLLPSYLLSAGVSSYLSTGTAATLTKTTPASVSCDSGAYLSAGTSANLNYSGCPSYILTASKGTYFHQGGSYLYDESGNILTADDGITPLTNDIPLVNLVYSGETIKSIAANAGTYTLTGTSCNLLKSSLVSSDSAAYTLTGTSATLYRRISIDAGSASYSTTGTSASLYLRGILDASTTSYTLTGTSATLRISRLLDSASSTYLVTGTAATLTKTTVSSISCDSGAYLVSGQACGLISTFRLSVDSGTYLSTGASADLTCARTISPESSAYLITGQTCTLLATRTLALESGPYLLVGSSAVLDYKTTGGIAAVPGEYALTGTSVSLIRVPVFQTGDQAYTVTGSDVSFIRSVTRMSVTPGVYTLTLTPVTFGIEIWSSPPLPSLTWTEVSKPSSIWTEVPHTTTTWA